jgi:hypothetical protein
MSDKEKQHYVPKFYLKRFSYRNNQSQIGVFNTKTNLFVQTAKLKTQAYRSFFYGKDGFIETQLGIIEGISAELIREISSNHYVPKLGSSDHQTILLHTVTSLMRTPTMTNSINETFSEMNNLVKGNAKEWNAKFEPIDSFDGEALKMALNGIKIGVDHCKDLCVKLIINRTKKPFITSDNPVVKYNSFMEKRNSQVWD